MKVLYLTFGTQSGVVTKLSAVLLQYGIDCKFVNVSLDLHYRYKNIKFPKLSIATISNWYSAYALARGNWKGYYFRTDYAYDWMSHKSEDLIKYNADCKIILQSGLLFSPEITYNKPYVLGILDNTYLIGKYGRNRPVTTLKLTDYFIKKETEAYHRANLILAMSNHVRLSLIEDYGIPSDKIIVTGVGPNVEPDGDYVPSNHKYHSLKIVMIAMEFNRKGGWEVLEAFKRLRKRIPSTQLIIIGEKLDVQMEGVSFIGVQDKTVIKKELSEANLYIMPSHAEPFGVAFIEAMAFSTPCIGSKVESIPEIISDGETGFLVATKDVDALAKRMEDILIDSSLAKAMGTAGHKKYMEQFSWAKVGKTISDQLCTF